MTDREMLEFAAKAAGIELAWSSTEGIWPRNKSTWRSWNPLTDDGDALRLAVKMRIQPKWIDDDAYAWGIGSTAISKAEPFDGDPEYATRRAIVRVAAEIGKQMS